MLLISNLVCKIYDKATLGPISLALSPGDHLGLTGVNGVGKSTLLRCFSGLHPKEAGNIDYQAGSRGIIYPLKADMLFYLGHKNYSYPDMTVEHNLKFIQKFLFKKYEHKKTSDFIDMFSMSSYLKSKACDLSQGSRRKLDLILVMLASSRKLLLLDEPLVNVDVSTKEIFEHHLELYKQSGGIVIQSGHEGISSRLEVNLSV